MSLAEVVPISWLTSPIIRWTLHCRIVQCVTYTFLFIYWTDLSINGTSCLYHLAFQLTTIKHAASRLLQTLENQRTHLIRRFYHVRNTNPAEWRHLLPEVRQHLSDLEHLLSNSLAKLDKVSTFERYWCLRFIALVKWGHCVRRCACILLSYIQNFRCEQIGLPAHKRIRIGRCDTGNLDKLWNTDFFTWGIVPPFVQIALLYQRHWKHYNPWNGAVEWWRQDRLVF